MALDLSSCTKLTTIGGYAFNNCTKAIINLPASITTIDQKAFGFTKATYNFYCKNIIVANNEIKKKVKDSVYPENQIIVGNLVVENGFYFSDNGKTILIGSDSTKTGAISIPATVVAIAVQAFEKREDITSLDFSACTQFVEIQDYAFFDCINIKNIIFPASLKSIGVESFAYCQLLELILPANLTKIDFGAFGECATLSRITIKSEVLTEIFYAAFYGIKDTADFTVKTENVKTLLQNSKKNWDGNPAPNNWTINVDPTI